MTIQLSSKAKALLPDEDLLLFSVFGPVIVVIEPESDVTGFCPVVDWLGFDTAGLCEMTENEQIKETFISYKNKIHQLNFTLPF